MTRPCLLGIDIGTTGVRGVAFDPSGARLAEASVPTVVRTPAPGHAEADADGWWVATCEVAKRVAAGAHPARVAAVGVTGQAPTAVLVDARGAPLRPAILWLDARADDEARDIGERLGADRCFEISRNRLHSYFLGPKLRWIRRHEPETLAAATSVLQSHSFVVARLTGEACIDPSTAALCAPLYDPAARAWSAEACAALEIPVSVLPRIAGARTVAGSLTADAARATGLAAGLPVVVGGGDFASATLGAGVLDQGESCLMLGTAGNLLMPLATAAFDRRLINSHHVGCDRYLTLGGTLAGAVQEWFRAVLARDVPYETLDAEAARVPAGADGLLLLPYLQGERTPLWNSDARGVFFGLRLSHGRGHLYRALLEGIALSFRHCQAVMAEHGLKLEEVVAVNGGGRSALWRQILADVLGVPLAWAARAGGTTAGAAIVAGLGAGLLATAASARQWRGDLVRHAPDPAAHERYDALFRGRSETYAALETRFAALRAGA